MTTVLELERVSVRYSSGGWGVQEASLTVEEGACVVILGPNGAGKSSLVTAIAGALPYEGISYAGSIRHRGTPILGWSPWRVARSGICFIAERTKVFPTLSAADNLTVFGGRRRSAEGKERDVEYAMSLFPALKGRLASKAGLLSGGEQQMLAIAGALVAAPDLLVIDEPTLGLAPILIEEVIAALRRIMTERRLSLLLVDQNAGILKIADKVHAMSSGHLSQTVAADHVFGPTTAMS